MYLAASRHPHNLASVTFVPGRPRARRNMYLSFNRIGAHLNLYSLRVSKTSRHRANLVHTNLSNSVSKAICVHMDCVASAFEIGRLGLRQICGAGSRAGNVLSRQPSCSEPQQSRVRLPPAIETQLVSASVASDGVWPT